MLALSRKQNEAIVLGNDIEITILEIKGEQVKIGITAPKSVPVYRKELYMQIKEANQEAIQQANAVEALKGLL
ncbi:MAG: carbon storage regulator CsrA [Lachnospiraceae bacterium]|nr:carbon storage regulator CsrA [Lachnospiraceae bacterium]MBP3506711.1 carbon storage regulator CsrA [Lachnospiraceae bacterium]